jgi:hypothetical protein
MFSSSTSTEYKLPKYNMASGFDPNKSLINGDKLQDFLRSPLEPEITSIPGIGPKTAESMAEENITTSYQVIGKFLSLIGENTSTADACDEFWAWLSTHNVKGYRSGVTECIAEKVNMMIPGLYSSDEFHKDEEE